jgi:7-cyano-7-deazaguanine synthase
MLPKSSTNFAGGEVMAGPQSSAERPSRVLTGCHGIVVLSGGLDSTVLAYWLKAEGVRLTSVSVDYGQRHRKELDHAARIADVLRIPHHLVDLTSITALLQGSALTDEAVPVPDGHYAAETMRSTVVPNRNAILLDMAVALAVSIKADLVAFGAHAGDHAIYPDCRPEFLEPYEQAARAGNSGFIAEGFAVIAPFLSWPKTDIVVAGAALNVPFDSTWSCYTGGELHCGRCGTCTERREAFRDVGVPDPTSYLAVAS